MRQSAVSARQARRGRPYPGGRGGRSGAVSLYTVFFLNGLVLASWAPRIPQVKEQLQLSDGQLGLALLGVALGSVPAMPTAGALVNRFGSRAVARTSVLVYTAAIALLGLARSLPELLASLAVLGAAVGTLDVAMNAHAVDLERSSGRTRLSSFHGLFSAGALAGALLGTLAAAGGVTPRAQFAVTAVVAVLSAGVAAAALRPSTHQHEHKQPDDHRHPVSSASDAGRDMSATTALAASLFSRFTPRLLQLSALGLCVLLIEGVVTDWASVYLTDSLHAEPGPAGAGYVAFALAMTAGRLGGDRAAHRFGPVRVVRGGALLTATGSVVTLATGQPVVAVVFFTLIGLGIAASLPLVVSAAGRLHTGSPGTAVATVSTTGYFAFLAGPPLIGFLASHSSVRAALLVLPVLAVVTALLAHLLKVEGRSVTTHRPAPRAASQR
ncbi:MFS transporter [Streptomyces pinistramenti]|uniref:MFS transporter n=1 Tax=Streptomyces pinistramenti TaxID=2884812 RepID=UPI001D06E3FA|nr:MFS transporter [Streptomyces pinistramenti]MCB5906933.1 MFS transporter [Streptomyces pinistramenti]